MFFFYYCYSQDFSSDDFVCPTCTYKRRLHPKTDTNNISSTNFVGKISSKSFSTHTFQVKHPLLKTIYFQHIFIYLIYNNIFQCST